MASGSAKAVILMLTFRLNRVFAMRQRKSTRRSIQGATNRIRIGKLRGGSAQIVAETVAARRTSGERAFSLSFRGLRFSPAAKLPA